jgi:hypothetical protein
VLDLVSHSFLVDLGIQLDERTRAIIESRLAGQDAETKNKAALFRAFIESALLRQRCVAPLSSNSVVLDASVDTACTSR